MYNNIDLKIILRYTYLCITHMKIRLVFYNYKLKYNL